MKKFVFMIIAVILAGCAAATPEWADLTIDSARQKAGIYPASLEVSVIGRDNRSEPAIIIYAIGNDPAEKIRNRVPPENVVQESVLRGLLQQGLRRGSKSNIAVVVAMEELQAKVTKSSMLYTANVHSHLRVTVSNNGTTLALDYDRQANKDSLTRPEILDLEILLNDQLVDIVSKILDDQRVRAAIKGKA